MVKKTSKLEKIKLFIINDFFNKIKSIMFNPVKTFNDIKKDKLTIGFGFFIVLLLFCSLIFIIIGSIASFFIFPYLYGLSEIPQYYNLILGSSIIFFPVIGIFTAIVIGSILHLFSYLFKGKGEYNQSIKAVIYGSVPILLLWWLPLFNIIAIFWTLALIIIGIREYHKFSTYKAILVFILPIIILFIISLLSTL